METHFVGIAGIGAGGEYFESKQVAYYYSQSDRLHWQLLPALAAINTEKGPLDVCRRVRQERPSWEVVWSLLGFDTGEMLFASKKSLLTQQRRDGSGIAIAGEYTRDTWTIDCKGLLVLLAHWSHNRRNERGRYLSKVFLELLLGKLARAGELDEILADVLGFGFAEDVCDEQSVDGICCHVQTALGAVPDGEATPQRRFVELLVASDKVAVSCASAREFLRQAIAHVAGVIAQRLEHVSSATDALVHSRSERDIGGRTRRWGETFRHTITTGLAKRGKARHASEVGSVFDACSRRMSEWNQRDMVAMQASAIRHFSIAGGTFVVASDGAQLGHPGEETNIYLMANHKVGLATWLIPQVEVSVTTIGGHLHGLRLTVCHSWSLAWSQCGVVANAPRQSETPGGQMSSHLQI